MSRRLVSTMVADEAGNRLGGSGTELSLWTDAALTVPAVLYQGSSGGGTQPNPISPNAGWYSSLSAPAAALATMITVDNVGTFQVGDLLPIFDATNTEYHVISAINPSTKVITLADALVNSYVVAGTQVGAADMIGHVYFWLDTAQDYYAQTLNVASGRVLPPIVIPVAVPVTGIVVSQEGVTVLTATTLDFRGAVSVSDQGGGVARLEFGVLYDAPWWGLS